MLRSIKALEGYTIRATDGDIGTADHFLFDDQHWTIRYLVVATGGWLSRRHVLISPIAILNAKWDAQRIDLTLTRQQVEHSPPIEADQPVSRQKELDYINYYGYQPYWGGAGVWGMGMYPAALATPGFVPGTPLTTPPPLEQDADQTEQGDPHLRSTQHVIDYLIQAQDGQLGHVDDFLVDDEQWVVRYMVVDTKTWWPGKKVLVAPEWIAGVEWESFQVKVDLPREIIQHAPEFDPYTPVSQAYESELHSYYQHRGYGKNTPR